MTTPKRIQRKRTKGWRMPEGAVNVTRPSGWSNPFRIGESVEFPMDGIRVTITRALAIELFRAYVLERGWEDLIRHELAGRDLMCWCAPNQQCHADVLLELANQ